MRSVPDMSFLAASYPADWDSIPMHSHPINNTGLCLGSGRPLIRDTGRCRADSPRTTRIHSFVTRICMFSALILLNTLLSSLLMWRRFLSMRIGAPASEGTGGGRVRWISIAQTAPHVQQFSIRTQTPRTNLHLFLHILLGTLLRVAEVQSQLIVSLSTHLTLCLYSG